MDTKFISINIAALIKYQATFYMFMSATLIFLAEGNMSQLLLLGKFEYTGGPIFKVVLEC